VWARDYNEIKTLGAENKSTRTPEQTEIAQFWAATHPMVYLPVVYSASNRDTASTTSPTAPGKTRSWSNVDEFMQEAICASV
jgi:hypothetical protein